MTLGSRRKSSPRRVAAAGAMALLTHGIVGVGLIASGVFQDLPLGRSTMTDVVERRPGPEREEPLQIETLVEQLDRPEEESAAERQQRQEEERTRPEGQVVDIAKPAIEQRPAESRFLAEYDSMVQREQKGPAGREQAGAARPPAPLVPPPSKAQPRRSGAPGPLALRALGRPDPEAPASMQELAPDGTTPRHLPGDRVPGGGGQPGSRPAPNLLATPEVLERALGPGAGSVDYLKDLDDGESTALSAKKWKFASFFNRLKRSVADEWRPDAVYLRHDPSGNIYGVKDRITVLRVHLKPDGRIANVEVLRASGVDFLDDEAVGAFKRAQPFPNPPQQLVESDGQIHFNFAFIFELSGRTSFKVFRY